MSGARFVVLGGDPDPQDDRIDRYAVSVEDIVTGRVLAEAVYPSTLGRLIEAEARESLRCLSEWLQGPVAEQQGDVRAMAVDVLGRYKGLEWTP